MATSDLADAFTLVTVDEVVQEMALNAELTDAYTPVILGAIRRATIKVEGLLGTSLQPRSVVDTFFVSGAGPLSEDGHYKLRLSQSLVRDDVDLACGFWDTGMKGQLRDLYDTILDPSKGILNVPAGVARSRYLQVSYAAGYNTDDTNVPEEIKQAIMLYVPVMMLSEESKETEATKGTSRANDLAGLALDMLATYLRHAGPLIKPMSTKVADYEPVTPPVVLDVPET